MADKIADAAIAAVLTDIAKEFRKLRLLAFLGAMFFLPVHKSVMSAGRVSQGVFTAMIVEGAEKSNDLPWWLETASALQARLHHADMVQIDMVSRASFAGMAVSFGLALSACVAFVADVAVTGGGVVAYSVSALCATWLPLSFLAERRVKVAMSDYGKAVDRLRAGIPALVRRMHGYSPKA